LINENVIIKKESNNNMISSKIEYMKVSELKKYCKENGIKGISDLKKKDIINKIIKLNTNKSNDINIISKNIKSTDKKKFKVLDLFCGCGGMTEGLKKTLNVVCGVDVWDKAIDSYKKNHNHLSFCEDLTKLSPKELKRIQSFPDSYILVGNKREQIMQIGNAVACEFAYHLGNYINNILQ